MRKRLMRKFLVIAAVTVGLLLSACNGGEIKGIDAQLLASSASSASSAGKVHIRLNVHGEDADRGASIIASLVGKVLASEKIKTAPTAAGAELVIYGTVRMRHMEATPRLGLDLHRYNAHAEWQIIRFKGGYHPIVKYVTDTEDAGVGKEAAVRSTLANLANQVGAKALPHLRKELTRP